jgi:selenocysteine lyase/cysteine desulfurase
MHRRQFMHQSALAAAAFATASLLPARARARPLNTTGDAAAFWRSVEASFAPAPDFLNLEYGYFCPSPQAVLEADVREARRIVTRASHYMRTERRDAYEQSVQALADLAGASREEIVITRNTTESMNIILQGIDLSAGDELVYSNQDYGSMVQAIRQRAARSGILPKEVALPLHPSSDEEIVALFEAAITPRTRLLHLTHMINLTGQILPVRAITEMAHAHGVEVAVDAAHSFAHIDFSIPDLGCDYLGTSLHKWLCAPLGLGMLYVKRDKIERLWPLMGDQAREPGDIRKFERMGTRPDQHVIALREAIRFHEKIGHQRKEARLRQLHTHWADAVRDWPGIVLNTPADPARHGAVGNVGLEGVTPRALADFLAERHRIFTVGIEHPAARGIRVTPGVPTPLWHIDRFIEALDDARRRLA